MKPIQFKQINKAQSGQLVFEYLLLLAVSVGLALILVSKLIKRGDDPDNVGSIVLKWNQMQNQIGKDQQE